MSEKTCKKCGHVAAYAGVEPVSCPSCGAVYAKVESALRAAAEARAARAAAPVPSARAFASPSAGRSSSDASPDLDVQAFAERMRSESLYPNWRRLVGVYRWIGYAVAIVILITGLVAIYGGAAGTGLAVVVAGIVTLVIVRAMVELSLMMADMSDATVRLAAQSESG